MLFRKKETQEEPELPEAAEEAPVFDRGPVIQSLEDGIATHRRLIFGLELFSEALALLHEGQDDLRETGRKQYRNIVKQTRESLILAENLLDRLRRGAKVDPETTTGFRFAFAVHHPQPEDLRLRAEAFVNAYDALFPEEPTPHVPERDALLRLIDHAAVAIPAT